MAASSKMRLSPISIDADSYRCKFQFYDLMKIVAMIPLYQWNSISNVEAMAVTKCPESTYIHSTDDGNWECARCSVCPKGFEIKINCTKNKDTVCRKCHSGFYSDRVESKCEKCSQCRRGEYIREDCNNTHNAVCRQCPSGMYSMFENSQRCRPCKFCKLFEDVTNKCNIYNDTYCGDCSTNYFRDGSTGNCLPCSYCNPDTNYVVIRECIDKLGINSNQVCLRSLSAYVPFTETSTFVNVESSNSAETYTQWLLPTGLASILLVIIIIMARGYHCYMLKQHKNRHSPLTSFYENRVDDNAEMVGTNTSETIPKNKVDSKKDWNTLFLSELELTEKPLIHSCNSKQRLSSTMSKVDSGIDLEEIDYSVSLNSNQNRL